MKRILAAVDFSESSTNAARYALQLAKDTPGASLTLYYAYEAIIPGADGTPLLVDSDARRTVALTALNNLKAEIGDPAEVPVDVIAETGSFGTAVEKYVEHLGIDLIVLGITGSTRLEQIVIGSNALNVINRDICPVLIVPSGAVYRRINKAVITTDLKDVQTTTPVKTLTPFLDAYQPSLYVAHVALENSPISESEQQQKENLETILQSYNPQFFYIRQEDFIAAIQKFIDEYNPDIIITVPRSHSFLSRLFKESYTQRLAYNSSIPILAVHSR